MFTTIVWSFDRFDFDEDELLLEEIAWLPPLPLLLPLAVPGFPAGLGAAVETFEEADEACATALIRRTGFGCEAGSLGGWLSWAGTSAPALALLDTELEPFEPGVALDFLSFHFGISTTTLYCDKSSISSFRSLPPIVRGLLWKRVD